MDFLKLLNALAEGFQSWLFTFSAEVQILIVLSILCFLGASILVTVFFLIYQILWFIFYILKLGCQKSVYLLKSFLS